MKIKKGYAYLNGKELGKIKDFQFDVHNNIKITIKTVISMPKRQTGTLVLCVYTPFLTRISNFIRKIFTK